MTGPVTGDGTVYQVTPDRQTRMAATLDAAMDEAMKHGEHLWIVAAAFRIDPAAAARLAAGEDAGALLDGGNLVSLAPGCFICEEPLTRTAFHRRCRGEQS